MQKLKNSKTHPYIPFSFLLLKDAGGMGDKSPIDVLFGAPLFRERATPRSEKEKNKFVFLCATPIFSPISKMRLRLTEVGNSIFFTNLQKIKFCAMMLANKSGE